MFSLSNGLSFLRAPLAFLFLFESTSIRILAILLAMLTDSIDGHLARRRKSVTRFGAILDPAMDKFFVFFALTVLCIESKLVVWQACAMISRDFFLLGFGIYLSAVGLWQSYRFRSIRWGKVTTALQFLILIGLTCNVHFSSFVYAIFILFGWLAFLELYAIKKQMLNATTISIDPK